MIEDNKKAEKTPPSDNVYDRISENVTSLLKWLHPNSN